MRALALWCVGAAAACGTPAARAQGFVLAATGTLPSTTYIDSCYSDQNLGGMGIMKNVVNSWDHDPGTSMAGSVTCSLLTLPTIAVPSAEVIQSVELNAYCSWYMFGNNWGLTLPPPVPFTMVLSPLTQGFVQGNGTKDDINLSGATWFTYDGTNSWTTPGGDFDSSLAVTASTTPVTGSWTSFDLTSAWTNKSLAAQRQEFQNNGAELIVSPENPNLLPLGYDGSWITEEFAGDTDPSGNFPYISATFAPAILTWNVAGSGTWQKPNNWQEPSNWSGVPGASPLQTAIFGPVLSGGSAAVTLDGCPTIAGLVFSPSTGGSYTLCRAAGDSTSFLTLTGTGTTFTLANSSGNNTLAVPVTLGSNLNVDTLGGSLTLSGSLSDGGNGFSLSKAGSGTLILSGANTYGGGTSAMAGLLVIASTRVVASRHGALYRSGRDGRSGHPVPAAAQCRPPAPAALAVREPRLRT